MPQILTPFSRRTAVIAVTAAATLHTIASAATASPTPTPTPTAGTGSLPFPAMPEPGGLGLNFGDWIVGQINHWFAELVAMSIQPLLELLAATLLATPNISGDSRVFDLWKATAAIANASFVLLLTIGAITAMGYETVQTRYAAKEVLPRLAIAFLATNTSFLVCGKAIELADALSQTILGQDFDRQRAATTLRSMLLPSSTMSIFYNLLALVGIILLILLLITFIKRAALVILLVVAAPLALACHALPHTDGFARFWWRAFAGLLIIQIAQSLTLVLAVRIFFNQDGRLLLGVAPTGQLINLMLALCLLLILVRIPGWISRRIFAQVGSSNSTIVRIFKYALAYKFTSPVLNALHLGRGRRSGKPSAAAKGVVASTLVGKVLPAVAGGPAGAAATTAATAAAAAHGGPGPVKHAPVGARRPVSASDWLPAPIKHAPTAPGVQGKYRPTPKPSEPIPRNTPVYGYPREVYYANGPAGLAQMYRLRAQGTTSPPPPRRAIEPPPIPARNVNPIVRPDAPIPGTPEWPENPGRSRRTPPRGRRKGGEKR
ncbi:conjugal transfer protein TrbL family protein [Nonomuraea sp. CA-141351]|uniref:conjugal transfer protein TrbL family protein n=1 Tax=Nonomuraea sp. CA-141351 TaxID=3239996 RepID=UPI003D91E86B